MKQGQNVFPTTQLIPNYYIMGLIFFVFCIFYRATQNDFVVWDDPRYVSENELIQNPSFENLFILIKSVVLLNFHPVTMASLWLNAFLFGNAAKSFILTNILIHCFNTYLIYKLANELNPDDLISLLIAAFWGLHPMHVESVVWVSERKDVLYTAFFLLGLLKYIDLQANNDFKQGIVLLYFTLSCLSKAMAIVFPFVLILVDYWFERKTTLIQQFKSKWLYFLISAIFFLISINTLSGGDLGGILTKVGTSQAVTTNQLSICERLSFSSFSLLLYLFKLIIPVQLHHWYVFPVFKAAYGLFILFPILLILSLYFSFKKNRTVFFGLIFFLINIILVLQILPNSKAMMAERYSYLSYFGLIFTLFVVSRSFIQKNKIVIIGLLLILLSFSYLSFNQTKNWKNTLALWEQTFKYHPENEEVAVSYINNLKIQSKNEAVFPACEIAIKSGAKSAKISHEMASQYIKTENYQAALVQLNQAINLAKQGDSQFVSNLNLEKAAVFGWLGKADSAAFYMAKIQVKLKK